MSVLGRRRDPYDGERIAFGAAVCGGKKRVEVAVDIIAMPIEQPIERVCIGARHRVGQRRALGIILRQVVRLRVVAILQPVLDLAQEHVGVEELVRRRCRQQAPDTQRGRARAKCREGEAPARAHRAPAAAPGR